MHLEGNGVYIPVSRLHLSFNWGTGNKGGEKEGKRKPILGFDIKN